MFNVTVTSSFDILTVNGIGVIYWPWLTKIPNREFICLIGIKKFRGQGFYVYGHCKKLL